MSLKIKPTGFGSKARRIFPLPSFATAPNPTPRSVITVPGVVNPSATVKDAQVAVASSLYAFSLDNGVNGSNTVRSIWTSSNTAVATVDASGNVTPVSAGNVSIQSRTGRIKTQWDLNTNAGNQSALGNWVAGSLARHIADGVDALTNGKAMAANGSILNAPIWNPQVGQKYQTAAQFLNSYPYRNPNFFAKNIANIEAVPVWGAYGMTPIAPDILLSCSHAAPANGGEVVWMKNDGTTFVATLDTVNSCVTLPYPNDCRLYKLSTPLPDWVPIIKLLPDNLLAKLPSLQFGVPVLHRESSGYFCVGHLIGSGQELRNPDNGGYVRSGGGANIGVPVQKVTTALERFQLNGNIQASWVPAARRGFYWLNVPGYPNEMAGTSGNMVSLLINNQLMHLFSFTTAATGQNNGIRAKDFINAGIAALGSTSTVQTADLSAFPSY